jgi:hypothetical protein
MGVDNKIASAWGVVKLGAWHFNHGIHSFNTILWFKYIQQIL